MSSRDARPDGPGPYKLLVVDDEQSMCEMLADSLTPRGFDVTWTTQPAEAERIVHETHCDAVLTDVRMRGLDGLQLCASLSNAHPNVPVIVMTAFGSVRTAVDAMRAGAYDFLTKPVDVEVVVLTVERAISHRKLRREVAQLSRVVAAQRGYGEFIGASPAMRGVYELIERSAPSEASILVTGESGTGKELVARAVHAQSERREGPFVSINCAALPEALLESELFGHAKGAFTDARTAREGLLVQANGGTLFLDEIGELPVGLQPKVLRALQERKVRPVGANHEVAVDFRLVSATNRDLEAQIEERRFREDLYYRVNVIHIALPPLRGRGGDILLLCQHFMDHFANQAGKTIRGLSAAVERLVTEYSWPGNVRELANCMEHAVVLCRGETLEPEDLPDKIRNYEPSHVLVTSHDPSELVSMAEVERRYILRVFEAVQRNKSQAAQILGVDRKTLYRKLESYGVD